MKKPTLKKFQEVAKAQGGNKSKIALVLGVDRWTVHEWCKTDPEFNDAILNCRGNAFDQVLESAVAAAAGIPKKNRKGEITGWKSYPDAQLAKYLLSTIGKTEGFGESIDITSGGAPIVPTKITSRKQAVDFLDNLEKEY